MQAAARITGDRSGSSHHLSDRAEHPDGNRPQKKNYGASGRRNDFLSTSLAPIAPVSIVQENYDSNYNYITQENYHFLRDSYFRYAELLRVKALHKVGKTVGESISNLYDEMNTLVGDDIELNFEPRGEQLCFVLWKTHQWGRYTLYWFPVRFVEKLPAQLRRIVISFLHQLMKSNGMDTMLDCYDTDMVLEWMDRESYEQSKEEEKKILAQVKSYEEGKIHRLLKRVDKKCYYKRLFAAFEEYTPQSDFERSLLTLMREGLQFIGDDKPSIMSYAYDPDSVEEPDFPPVDLDRQIRIIYDNDDQITESLVDTFNCDLRETYEITPVTTLELSPTTQQTFAMGDYPECFFSWADKFVNLTSREPYE